MITEQQIEMAKALTQCKSWKEFKEKWDGKNPRKGSRQFEEYCADANRTTKAQEKVMGQYLFNGRVNE